MLKDMLKLATEEIINLWISFIFFKTTCPDQGWKQMFCSVVSNQPFGLHNYKKVERNHNGKTDESGKQGIFNSARILIWWAM